MKKFNWQTIMKWLSARHPRERVVLLCAGLGIVVMLWLALVHDVITAAKENELRAIASVNSQIQEEQKRQADIRATYTTDPNNFALSRQRELREAMETATARLNQLYGELITPQQMSQVLTAILQRETALQFVSLSNSPSEPLLTGAADPADAASPSADTQVFKHGLTMVFEGNFLETVQYLRSLERLDGSFFWDSLEFELLEYPNARIRLDIYTLSTEQGWIGV